MQISSRGLSQSRCRADNPVKLNREEREAHKAFNIPGALPGTPFGPRARQGRCKRDLSALPTGFIKNSVHPCSSVVNKKHSQKKSREFYGFVCAIKLPGCLSTVQALRPLVSDRLRRCLSGSSDCSKCFTALILPKPALPR